MTDTHQKKDPKNAHTISPIAAGIAGVVAGGVAVAAAIVMSDKKNQKKVTDSLAGAKEKVTHKLEEVVHAAKQKIETRK